MPARVRKQGLEAIAHLERHLVGIFGPTGGAAANLDCATLDELLSSVGLLAFKPRIFECGFTTAGPFVAEICAALRQNPILVAFAAEVAALPSTELLSSLPPAGAQRDAELRTMVVYCFMLHGLCTAVMEEPRRDATDASAPSTLYKQIFDILGAMRSEVQWKPYTNKFERMKVASIDLPVKKHYLPIKEGEKEVLPRPGKGLLLSVNILEAMYQDTHLGNDANAAAGFELMLEPYQRAPIAGLENALSALSDDRRGLLGHSPCFPRVWANLYSSWNGAFVSNYAAAPLFLAKLYNPATSGTYHREGEQSLYLFPRVFTLWVHIHAQIFERAANQSASPLGLVWSSPLLTLLWGKVNLLAATELRAMIDDVVTRLHNGVHPDRRDGMGTVFRLMRRQMVPQRQRRFTLVKMRTVARSPSPTSSPLTRKSIFGSDTTSAGKKESVVSGSADSTLGSNAGAGPDVGSDGGSGAGMGVCASASGQSPLATHHSPPMS